MSLFIYVFEFFNGIMCINLGARKTGDAQVILLRHQDWRRYY